MPEGYFRKMGIGSRATFFRWEKAGLRIVRVGGRRFIYRSDLRTFLEGMDQEAGKCKPTPGNTPRPKEANGRE